MDLAQHFDMNYDQILRKRTNKGQKKKLFEQCEKHGHAFL